MISQMKYSSFIYRVIIINAFILHPIACYEIPDCSENAWYNLSDDSDGDFLSNVEESQNDWDNCDPCSPDPDCEACRIQPIQLKYFDFSPWGIYYKATFNYKDYLIGYKNMDYDYDYSDAILYEESGDKNLIDNEQMSEILIDTDTTAMLTASTPLELKEGYELILKDLVSPRLSLELRKDGKTIDNKVIGPTMENAVMKDKTYYYKQDLGENKKIVIIAIHFKNAKKNGTIVEAIADGIFQISDSPISIETIGLSISEDILQRI